MHTDILSYNSLLSSTNEEVTGFLAKIIHEILPEADGKIWHSHPVWFIEENPVVGYSSCKEGIKLLFWSGQSFDENNLRAQGKFKAAEYLCTSIEQINTTDLKRWLMKSRDIQWDYKNLVKRKGILERLK